MDARNAATVVARVPGLRAKLASEPSGRRRVGSALLALVSVIEQLYSSRVGRHGGMGHGGVHGGVGSVAS